MSTNAGSQIRYIVTNAIPRARMVGSISAQGEIRMNSSPNAVLILTDFRIVSFAILTYTKSCALSSVISFSNTASNRLSEYLGPPGPRAISAPKMKITTTVPIVLNDSISNSVMIIDELPTIIPIHIAANRVLFAR